MLEFLGLGKEDAISLIKADHDKVKGLFDQFEKAEKREQKRSLVLQAILELKLHAEIEEKIFYARVRPELDREIMTEADEEHHVAKVLVAELEQMNGSEEHFDAKFKVLAENIRHHIKEEEGNMLPKARGLNLDYVAMCGEIKRMKEKMLKDGIPVTAEEKMVVATRGNNDSPASAAVKSKTTGKVTSKAASKTKTPAKATSPVGTSRTASTAKSGTARKTTASSETSKPAVSPAKGKPASKRTASR